MCKGFHNINYVQSLSTVCSWHGLAFVTLPYNDVICCVITAHITPSSSVDCIKDIVEGLDQQTSEREEEESPFMNRVSQSTLYHSVHDWITIIVISWLVCSIKLLVLQVTSSYEMIELISLPVLSQSQCIELACIIEYYWCTVNEITIIVSCIWLLYF